jgi:hypothetical protein
MLFPLVYITDDIEKINEIPLFFFQNFVNANAFSLNLFPVWARPLIRGASVLKSKFTIVFNTLSVLSTGERQNLYNRLLADLSVSSICNNTTSPLCTERDYMFAHSALHDVFIHLYNQTLQKSIVLNRETNSSISNHFIKWKRANYNVVCPFCGLENYTTSIGTNRDPYDHWLCKSKYPLSAVNFRNLVPIGDKCNQSSVKGEKDIVHFDNYVPRVSYYPYSTYSGIRVVLRCISQPTVGYKGEWNISIEPIDPLENNLVETWIDVFNIRDRYLSWVTDYLEGWKDAFEIYLKNNNIQLNPTIDEAKNALMNWKNSLLPIQLFSGVIILEAYIDYLLRDAGDSVIFAFCNMQLN